MRLRDRFVFDYDPACEGVKYFLLLAATPDRRTWWCVAGVNGGIRVLAHFAPDGEVYTADRLHAETLIKCDCGVRDLLQNAADKLNVTDMIAPCDLPGFSETYPYGRTYHRDGWYTRTERVLPLPAPTWAPDARAWDIREGVYVVFADESYRLVQRKEYYDFLRVFPRPPIARQGDLLVFDEQPVAIRQGLIPLAVPRCILRDDSGNGKEESLDRHTFRPAGLPDAGEFGCVLHPEHDRLDLPGTWETLILAPGTSRPFQGTGVVD